MMSELTPYQQQLVDAAKEWADDAYQRRYEHSAKAKFRELVERAVDSEELEAVAMKHNGSYQTERK